MLENNIAGVRKMLVQPQARQTSPQQAGERRLAGLERRTPQVLAVQLQQVEGVQQHMAAVGFARRSNTARPLASQATASPSIKHECTLSRLTASTISG